MKENRQDIEAYIQSRQRLIEERLRRIWPAEWQIPERLREAMMYSVLAGGKRMRPILTLAAAEALGGDMDTAMPVACAMEIIHTYSLIHDDLPAMDNDDFRRGKPTNHKVFGEAMAILAGDGLLTHAFHLVADTAVGAGLGADRALRIVAEMSAYAGPGGMVGGQAADIMGEQGVTTEQELEYIHLHKTSALIVCALRAGGHCAGADERRLSALEKFGSRIGLAFQILDDVLDEIGDAAKLGKTTQSDRQGGKVTYPYLLGIEACKTKIGELTEEGIAAVAEADFPAPQRLIELAQYLMRRDF